MNDSNAVSSLALRTTQTQHDIHAAGECGGAATCLTDFAATFPFVADNDRPNGRSCDQPLQRLKHLKRVASIVFGVAT